MPNVTQLRQWTGEPFFNPDAAWLSDVFHHAPDRSRAALAQWSEARDGGGMAGPSLYMGSRRGEVLFWAYCRLRHRTGKFDPALYAALTASVWIEGKGEHACREFGICEPSEMLDALTPFALSSVIMSKSDLAAHDALPDFVTLYRGGTGPADVLALGSSWTVHRTIADRFATRRPNGIVIDRTFRKADLIAFFDGRDEGEAVVRIG